MSNNPYGMSWFTGKIALVTGGVAGMGRTTARRLAAEGATIIVADRDVEV
jgi:NAD(P)-dependent dehydrogenase (short-subunit alcohol dehydrogenase family)